MRVDGVTFIVEWENAKLSELDRARRMLAQLDTQARDLAAKRGFTADLLVLFDENAIDPAIPRTAVSDNVDESSWPGRIGVIGVDGLNYYQQKNRGAELAEQPFIIFVDSDIIPDAGWLEALVEGIEEKDAEIVGGEAYLSRDTTEERIWSMFWLFGTKPFPAQVYPKGRFYANNVIFRRDTFLRYRFPEAEGHRGHCAALARSMRDDGIVVYRQGRAAVSHPPPLGIDHGVTRALSQGHASITRARQKKGFLRLNPVASILRLLESLLLMLVKMARRLLASPSDIVILPLALLAGTAYYVLVFVGEIMSLLFPRRTEIRYRI